MRVPIWAAASMMALAGFAIVTTAVTAEASRRPKEARYELGPYFPPPVWRRPSTPKYEPKRGIPV